jgi:regulator of RNase E activity RraA
VDSGPRDNLAAWAALEIAKPGDIILITTGGHLTSSVAGDLYVGMAKNAGDIVVGDQDGIVVVARRSAAAVAAGLKTVLAREKKMETSVKAGTTMPGWLEETMKAKGVEYLD